MFKSECSGTPAGALTRYPAHICILAAGCIPIHKIDLKGLARGGADEGGRGDGGAMEALPTCM